MLQSHAKRFQTILFLLVGLVISTAHTSADFEQPPNNHSPIERLNALDQQAYVKASNTNGYDEFGYAVAIYGNTAVVGAIREDSSATGVDGNQNNNSATNAGAAYVFVRDGSQWMQQAYLKASNTDAGDRFGEAVAIFEDTIVVSALYEASASTYVNGDQTDNSVPEAGAAYVFVRNGDTWEQEAYLKASNTDAGDWFGRSVAIHENTIIVGAQFEASQATGVDGDQTDNSVVEAGAGYVFVRDHGEWKQEAYLKASNTDPFDWFGRTVGVYGNTIVVGAQYESSNAREINGDQDNNYALNAGAAYVFVRHGESWSQQAYLKASNADPWDSFGRSVGIYEETIVVGANAESSNATDVNGDQFNNNAPASGAAFVFVRSGNTWEQQAYLKASNTGAVDLFGAAVGISGDTIVVGASEEDSSATGVDGDGSDNSTTTSGAAYLFTRAGTTWSPQAYLKPSNTDTEDRFGNFVAVSNDRTIVGASLEDSYSMGINNDDTNNYATSAGAAYIFAEAVPTALTLQNNQLSNESIPFMLVLGVVTILLLLALFTHVRRFGVAMG